MIWAVFAVLTGIAVLAVLWPLARAGRGGARASVNRDLYAAAVAAIDRDVERGLTNPGDAEAAKAEAARRLIAASAGPTAPAASIWNRRLAALAALVAIPAVSLGLYRVIGAAEYPDRPLEARLKAPPDATDVNVALARIEDHLKEQPDDIRGWEIIAPVYLKLDRPRDSAQAWQHVIQLGGVTAPRAAAFGEALVYAEEGHVTAQAKAAFEAALKEDPLEARAKFYLGLEAEQTGDKPRAIELYSQLVQQSPNAPFVPMVRERIATLGGDAPAMSGPNSAVGQAVQQMSPEDQQRFMRERIEGLAARLHENGGGVDEWLRLVRAYNVLGERDKAIATLADARKALMGDDAARQKMDDIARELGLGG